jgi:hypothetical protein
MSRPVRQPDASCRVIRHAVAGRSPTARPGTGQGLRGLRCTRAHHRPSDGPATARGAAPALPRSPRRASRALAGLPRSGTTAPTCSTAPRPRSSWPCTAVCETPTSLRVKLSSAPTATTSASASRRTASASTAPSIWPRTRTACGSPTREASRSSPARPATASSWRPTAPWPARTTTARSASWCSGTGRTRGCRGRFRCSRWQRRARSSWAC